MRASVVALLLLTGCATHPAGPDHVTAPVPVSCVPADFPGPPQYPDTREALKAAPDFAARDQLMRAGWDMRDSRLAVVEKQLDACR